MKKKQILFAVAVVMLTAAISMGSLVGYWDFEGGSGTTVADMSGNSRVGILYANNGTTYPQWIAGYIGSYALRFNAAATSASNSNSVVVDPNSVSGDPNAPSLGNLGQIFTIAMWVRRDAVDQGYTFFPRLVSTNAYDVQLALDPDWTGALDQYNYFGWAASGNSENRLQLVDEQDSSTLGSWYHLAIVCDGVTIKEYINGTQAAVAGLPGSDMLDVVTQFFMGTKADGSAYFNGALDDVAVWAGSYLPAAEVEKLANLTATPLTVEDIGEPVIPVTYSLETALYASGTIAALNPDMTQLTEMVNNQVVYNTSWVFPEPNSRLDIRPFAWKVKDEADYADAAPDISKYGVEWVDSSWNGRAPDMAVVAAYITPGLIYGQENGWYQIYNPNGYAWENKPYFRTNIRVAAVHSNGASVRVTAYSRSSSAIPDPNNHSTLLTYLGEVVCPLDAGDYVWQHYEITLPKPASTGIVPLWFETAIVGGTEDTVLYIDNFRVVSDVSVTFKKTDLNKDSSIDVSDFGLMASNWLDSANTELVDPRSGGLLVNGDFSADIKEVLTPGGTVTAGSSKVMNPTGWTFTGSGDYGVCNTSQRGRTGWYYTHTNWQPAGGDVSAFTTDMFPGDPNGVLSQTASATVVSGQTYYAMGYVMGHMYTSDNDLGEWYSWKDTATMEIAVDGVVKATVSRRLSRSIWRALYTTYTAVPADAGKSISIRFSYANSNINVSGDPSGAMNIGYAYLGTTMPTEYPEKRINLLVNGGFEDLSIIQTAIPSLYTSLTTSDNSGAWLVSGAPALLPNWIYEVAAGYDLNNQGGVFSSAYYGSPIPSPGLNDVAVYGSGSFVLGQIVGTLTSGTTYYLDTACGLLVDPLLWGGATYTLPSPAPKLNIELWRIPAGVTNPDTIHTGVITPLTGYVKIAEAHVDSTGDIKKTADTWQIVGTSYTATSADTNVYVRIYGTNPVTYKYPSFVFSDVYLSTQKRLVTGSTPGNSLGVKVSSGVQYDALGAYNCYQASLMGFTAPANDINGDCRVNLNDFSILAEQWLEVGIEF